MSLYICVYQGELHFIVFLNGDMIGLIQTYFPTNEESVVCTYHYENILFLTDLYHNIYSLQCH